jgi:hypothetical protein
MEIVIWSVKECQRTYNIISALLNNLAITISHFVPAAIYQGPDALSAQYRGLYAMYKSNHFVKVMMKKICHDSLEDEQLQESVFNCAIWNYANATRAMTPPTKATAGLFAAAPPVY